MRSLHLSLAFLFVATVVVFSAPVPSDEDVSAKRVNMVRGLGLLGLLGLFSIGRVIALHMIKGAIDSRSHRQVIDYFFENLRKLDEEGETERHERKNEIMKDVVDGYDSASSDFESE